MAEKFERFSISVNPDFAEQIRKAAQEENIPVSRFVTNAALKAAKSKPLTKEQIEALQREIRPLVLKALEEELSEKITGRHSAEDFRKFLEVKKRSEDEEISQVLGFDKPVEIPDALEIAKGRATIQQANREIAKAEAQEVKKFLEESKNG